MFTTAKEILQEINALGYDAYIVGGAVRDYVMQKPLHDIDIATNAPLEVLQEHFHIMRDVSKNMNLGVYLLEKNGFIYEVANFRIDAISKDHRHPKQINFINSFKEDASRRDFTINAMGMDCHGNIIDFFDGKNDIKNNVIRTVGCSFDRFGEDFVRVLRAVRFAARYDFHFDKSTADAISMCGECLLQLSPERIQTELEKMAGEGGKSFANAIALMHELHLLQVLLPEIDVLFDLPHTDKYHPEGLCKNVQCEKYEEYAKNHAFCNGCPSAFNSVGKHVLETLRVCESKNMYQLFALLFHDVGKGTTYQLREKHGELQHTYHGHDTASEALITAIAKRLKWSKELKETTLFCAKNHMIFHDVMKLNPYKLLLLMESRYFQYLVETSYCDSKARQELFQQSEWDTIFAYLEEFKNTIFAFSKNISGKKIMEVTGIQSGIRLGNILRAVKKHAANHKILDTETLDKTIRFYEKCIK